jgi:hypothetical protein
MIGTMAATVAADEIINCFFTFSSDSGKSTEGRSIGDGRDKWEKGTKPPHPGDLVRSRQTLRWEAM